MPKNDTPVINLNIINIGDSKRSAEIDAGAKIIKNNFSCTHDIYIEYTTPNIPATVDLATKHELKEDADSYASLQEETKHGTDLIINFNSAAFSMLNKEQADKKILEYNRKITNTVCNFSDTDTRHSHNPKKADELMKQKIQGIDTEKIISNNVKFIGKQLAQIINSQNKDNITINLLVCKSVTLQTQIIKAIKDNLTVNSNITLNMYSNNLYDATFVDNKDKITSETYFVNIPDDLKNKMKIINNIHCIPMELKNEFDEYKISDDFSKGEGVKSCKFNKQTNLEKQCFRA